MDAEFAQHAETLAVHAGERRPGPEGSVVYPIYQGTVYESSPDEAYHDIKYLRLNSTPTQRYLFDKLAALEGAEAGLAAASGMAAVTSILHTLLRAGDHLLVGSVMYGGTFDFVVEHGPANGWNYTFVDPHDPDSWEAAKTPNTKAILVESIVNPLLRVGELERIAEFARANGLVSVVDNTFATPINLRPLELGFDLVFHSATKYLNGHSDLTAGAVMGSAEHVDSVRHTLNLYGGSLDPHAGFLLARGMKTLALRMKAHNANGMALARFLDSHPAVAQVNYPGLPDHPDHALASRLLSGYGGMLSLRPAGGVEAAERLVESVRLPYSAPSLGGVESLITRPAVTSHAGMNPEDRRRLGIADDLVRISCGVEAEADLRADFAQALDKL